MDSNHLNKCCKPGGRWRRPKQIAVSFLAVSLCSSGAFSQTGAPGTATPNPELRRYHLEFTSFDNNVSNQFGHWSGGGLRLSYKWSDRVTTTGQVFAQRRPGEIEPLGGVSTLIEWSKWFYTDMAVSGGGPDDPAAFFPRVRYDGTANFKPLWIPGLILNVGLTRLYFGSPTSGRVFRPGAVFYWRRFVFQGNVYFNNVRPGNRKSKSANGAMQYGQEGRYWFGLVGGGGREAWQTLALTPQDTEFTSYSGSVFLRKWLAPNYGIHASYSYSVKRTAYRIHGLEFRFFLDF